MRRSVVLGIVSVFLVAGCGGGSGSAPGLVSSPGGAATPSVSTSVSEAPVETPAAGAGAQYADLVCQAIKDTLADLSGMSAPDASYQAGVVLKLASSAIPPDQLSAAMDDAAVMSACSAEYEEFLAKAKVPSLGSL